MTNYNQHLGQLNFRNISFPVKVTDVAKFDRQNQALSVNVFGWEKGLYLINASKLKGIAIDLLLIADEANSEKTHYVWIKNLARMCYYNSKLKRLKYPCRSCLNVFSRFDLLEPHQNDCLGIGVKPQRTIIPEAGKNILSFTSYHKQIAGSQ